MWYPGVTWNFSLLPIRDLPLLCPTCCIIFNFFSHLGRAAPPRTTQERLHGRLIFEIFHVCLKIALFCPCIWLTVWPGTRFQIGNYFPSDLEGIAPFLLDFTIAVEKSDTSLLPESLYVTYFFPVKTFKKNLSHSQTLSDVSWNWPVFSVVVLGTQCTLSYGN